MASRKTADKDLRDVFNEHERHRGSLIPILQVIMREEGYISEAAVKDISDYLDISESDVYGVATFYAQFRFTRPGDHIVKVCRGTACHVRGVERIMDEASRNLGIRPGETTPDYKFSLDSVACFGSCALSPVVVIDEMVHGRMTAQKIKRLLKAIE